MNLLLRALVILLVWLGLHFVMGDVGNYERPIVVLGLLGTVALVLGPLATGTGYWSRFHYVNTGTPGCVWVALGIVCWVAVIVLIVSARQMNP